jgi:hypothetical protein
MPDEQRRAQDFIENRKDQMMPWIVDVRDIGRAHVLAAEVRAHAGMSVPFLSACALAALSS